MVLYASDGSLYLLHAESMRSDSLSTELTLNETLCRLSQRRRRLHINCVNLEGADIYEDFIIFALNSADVEFLSALTQLTESHWLFNQLTKNENSYQLSHRQLIKKLIM
jgi:hypothetical protein